MPTVRCVADHAVDDSNGAVLLPGQTADWDAGDYLDELVAAGLVAEVDDEGTSSVAVAEPDPGAGKTGDPSAVPANASGSTSSGGSSGGSSGSGSGSSTKGSSGSGSSSGSSDSAGSTSTSSTTPSGGSQ